MALFLESDRYVAHMVPKGATVSIEAATFNGNKLVEVTWEDKVVMMFTQDLRSRGRKVE